MPKATRASFGEAVVELAENNSNIVVVDADLSKSTMTGEFAEKFPERYYNVGIAEGNLVGVGAGLALSGKIPFITSFSCFLIGRFEQIRMSIAYTNANVKIIGTHVGIGIGEDGYSQMALEDISIIRALPNIVIIQPADDIEAKKAVHFAADYEGPCFLRLTRQKLEDINPPDYEFKFGKGVVLKEGSDIAAIASGGVVYNTLTAANELEKEGVSVEVINIHTISPIDKELIIYSAKKTGKVITVEDHSINGGLGGAVCELLSEKLPTKVKRHGLKDFGESGSTEDLYQKYGLSPDGIKNEIKELLK
ncbi:transketolase family protein [candidate division KSB1 bacterium]